jgi:AraC-like DNA-binding protein
MPLLEQGCPQTLVWLDWTHLQCDLIWIYDGPVRFDHLFLKEFMPGQSALLIREGDIEVSTEQGTIAAKAGEWIFMNEGSRMQRFSPHSQILSIRFHCTWPGRQPLFDWDVATVVPSEEAPALEACAKEIEQLVVGMFPSARLELREALCGIGDYLEVQRLYMRWIQIYAETLFGRGHVLSRFEMGDPRIIRAVQLIEHHPLQQPFRESNLARQVNLSASQLGKLFIQKFGISPCRYFERRRFEEAIARVRSTSAPLKAIAQDLGFSSLPHFSSWFRRKARISPSDLRMKSSHPYSAHRPRLDGR